MCVCVLMGMCVCANGHVCAISTVQRAQQSWDVCVLMGMCVPFQQCKGHNRVGMCKCVCDVYVCATPALLGYRRGRAVVLFGFVSVCKLAFTRCFMCVLVFSVYACALD